MGYGEEDRRKWQSFPLDDFQHHQKSGIFIYLDVEIKQDVQGIQTNYLYASNSNPDKMNNRTKGELP